MTLLNNIQKVCIVVCLSAAAFALYGIFIYEVPVNEVIPMTAGSGAEG